MWSEIRLGLYRSSPRAPLHPPTWAETRKSERYVREWLGNQGAAGIVQFDATKKNNDHEPEQRLCRGHQWGRSKLQRYNMRRPPFRLRPYPRTNSHGKGSELRAPSRSLSWNGAFSAPAITPNLINVAFSSRRGPLCENSGGSKGLADVGYCGHGDSAVHGQTYPNRKYRIGDTCRFHRHSPRQSRCRSRVPNVQLKEAEAVSYRGESFDSSAFSIASRHGDPVGVSAPGDAR